ncbi:MAG TPA: hypothetical protein VEC36_03490 [Patescibacteria group bacterium]|nr:hypothetical protein [Patescibacteria group bacterium]
MPPILQAMCFTAIFLLSFQEILADSTNSLYKLDINLSGALLYYDGVVAPTAASSINYSSFSPGRNDLKRKYPHEFTKNPQDSPFNHGALYFKAAISASFFDILKANADLFAEHRGMSYGVNNYDNIAVFPRFLMSLDTSITLSDERLQVHASAGHYYYPRLYEGLTIYNMETQGSALSLQYGHFKIGYRKTGDLFTSIGLGINDGDDIMLSLVDFPLTATLKADVQYGAYRNSTVPILQRIHYAPRADITDYGQTASLGIYTDSTFRLYGQFGLRGGNSDFLARTAFVAGMDYSAQLFKNLTFTSKTEFRRYNYLFNYGYYNYDVDYRNPQVRQSPGNWGNTIGPQIYPLYAFERPFSQWAVFTEYVNKSVSAFTLNFDAKYQLPFDFFLKGGVDFNYIIAQDNETALYPFYAIGGGWEPFNNTSFNLFLSNKGMNLDKQYPTFVIFEKPFLNVAIKWNL